MTGCKDIRILAAEQIYDNIEQDRKNGEYYYYVLNKAAREGATTSFTSVAINRNMPILVLEPTNKITTETIGKDGIKYSDKPYTPMHYVYSNKHCTIIKDMISKTPSLGDLPYILLPKRCYDCEHFDICEYAEILRDEDVPVVASNYSKMTYVQAGSYVEDSVSCNILSKLLTSKVVLFDEIHYMQNLSPIIVPFIFIKKEDNKEYDMLHLDKYRIHIPKTYSNIYKMLDMFEKIIKNKNIKQSINKVIQEASNTNYWEKHISEPLNNPYYIKSESQSTKLAIKFAVEMSDLVQKEEYGKLSVKNDLLPLYNLLNIVCSKILTIGFDTGNLGLTIKISSPNILILKMMKELLIELKMKNIQVIFTSATICDLETDSLSEYWIPNDTKIKELLFGGNGSPLQSNSRLILLCDSSKLSNKGNYSLYNSEKLNEIVGEIKSIIFAHGIENCKVVAKNKNEAMLLLKSLSNSCR